MNILSKLFKQMPTMKGGEEKKEGKEQIVQFVSWTWSPPEKNYSTIEKEVKATWNCIDKFDIQLIHKRFLLRTNDYIKKVLSKAIKKVGEAKFARWQALFTKSFNFEVEHIKGKNNYLPDILIREYLNQKETTMVIVEKWDLPKI